MTERHTAVNIARHLSETIKEWDLLPFCTLHHNASNMNLAIELCELFPKGAISSFKNMVRQQLETRFKLEPAGLAESILICMLDPRFKHLQFIPESMREDACEPPKWAAA